MVRPTAVTALDGFRGSGGKCVASANLSALATEKFDPRRLKPQNCYGGHSGRGGKVGKLLKKDEIEGCSRA
jgi:hypothetical protein